MTDPVSKVVNLSEKFARIDAFWAPKIVAQFNGLDIRLVRLKGEFTWHSHADTDEVFVVLDGSLTIQMRDRDVELASGELFVVPRGTEHRPVAQSECRVMLIEPAGTLNTGDAGGEQTSVAEWV